MSIFIGSILFFTGGFIGVSIELWRKEQEQIGEIEFVFSFDGLPPSPKTFRTRIQKLVVQVGAKPITLHGL